MISDKIIGFNWLNTKDNLYKIYFFSINTALKHLFKGILDKKSQSLKEQFRLI